jgi:hypothetical protein
MIIRSQPVMLVMISLLPVSVKMSASITLNGPSAAYVTFALLPLVVPSTRSSISFRYAVEGTLYWSRAVADAPVETVLSNGSSSIA